MGGLVMNGREGMSLVYERGVRRILAIAEVARMRAVRVSLPVSTPRTSIPCGK